MKEGCLGQESRLVFDLELIQQQQKEENKLEIVRRLLEKGQNQRERLFRGTRDLGLFYTLLK